VLVAFAANLLLRKHATGGPILVYSTAAMFVLATLQFLFRILAARKAYLVFYLAVGGQFAPESELARNALAKNVLYNFVEDVLLVTNNALTDGVLVRLGMFLVRT
jgi:hypothetical protein